MVESRRMILYFPYGTNAPIYYRPIVTYAMMLINLLVFISYTEGTNLFNSFIPEHVEPYMLALGAGLHPVQWFTSNFIHASIFQLFFCMLFLWIFGIIVEGKLGPYKMLPLYLGIGILVCAAKQMLSLGLEPTQTCGALSIVFGLAAICLIWAPENEIDGVLIVFFVFFKAKHLETKISVLVTIFLLIQLLPFFVFGGTLYGTLLYLVGAFTGFIFGIVMLKLKLVDCEHWDILSVWKGENLWTDEERAAIEENKPEAIKHRQERRQKRDKLFTEEIELALTNRTPLPAFIIAQRKEREFADWKLPQPLHLKMIQQLLSDKYGTEAVTAMRQYLQRHKEQAVFVSLMLAQTLISQNKPKAAVKVLDNVPLQELAMEQQSAIQKVRSKAEAMHQKNLEAGIYEMEL